MPPAYDTYRRTRFFNSLDGLRCASILAVIWQHTGGQFGGPWTNTLLGRGYMGVELFFVISGFLITTLLLREKETYGEISLHSFYARRTLRIFPLYYTVLAIYVVMILMTERHSEAGMQFFHNLRYFGTYTSNLFVDLKVDREGNARTIFIFAWSLATEEQFYLLWPSAVRFLGGLRPLAIIGGLIALDQAVRFHLMQAWIPSDGEAYRLLTTISTAICFGVVLAYCLHSRRGFAAARRLIGGRWAVLAAALAVIGVLAIPKTDGVAWWRLAAHTSMASLVAAVVIRDDHLLAPLLTARLPRSIGRVSYGMYMLHMLALHAVDRVLVRMHLKVSVASFLAGAVVTYGVALLSYRWYESYFLKLKERWSRRTVGPIRRTDEPQAGAGAPNITGAPSVATEQQLSGGAAVAISL